MNGGDRSQEEQLQEVVWVWDQIKTAEILNKKTIFRKYDD